MSGMYKVYEHVNKINGKRYIGITCRELGQRWGKDGANYRFNEHFWNAINKYGWNEGFEHRTLLHGLTPEQASAWEIRLIAHYRTTDANKGYNNDFGGIRGFSCFSTDDMVIRLRDFMLYYSPLQCAKENNLTPIQVVNMCYVSTDSQQEYMWLDEFNSLSFIEKEKSIYGSNIMPQELKDNHLTLENYKDLSNAVSIIDLSTLKIYSAIWECVKDLHVSANTINSHCNGLIRYKVPRRFMYLSEYNQLSDEEKLTAYDFKKEYRRGLIKPVVSLINGNIYINEYQCALNNEATPYTITNHCLGNVRGFTERSYMYLSDYILLSQKERAYYYYRLKQFENIKYVTLIDGKVYDSIRSWKTATGGKRSTLLKHCENNLKNPDDRLYMYKFDYDKLSNEEKEVWKIRAKKSMTKLIRTSGLPTAVVRLSDGVVFDMLKTAAKACHCSERMVSDHCHGKAKKDRINFMFLSDYEKLTEKEKLFYKSREGIEKIVTKNKVIDLSTGEVYKSLRDCSNCLGLDNRYIAEHCKGLRKMRRFMYLYEYESLSTEEKQVLCGNAIDLVQNPDKYRLKNKAIIRLSDKHVFYSIKACAAETGIHECTIIRNCKGVVKAYKFMYLSEYIEKYGEPVA